jgi:hypothetical protein
MWVNQFSIAVKKYPRKPTYKEERIIFTQCFMDFIPWSLCSVISHRVVKQYIVDKVWTREKLLISS